jgi:CRP-like cAMP-binding protein
MDHRNLSSTENFIIQSLSTAAHSKLKPYMELVSVKRGDELHRAGQPIDYAYFPVTALISLMGITADGKAIEVGMVGHEGFLGVPILFGAVCKQYSAPIQIAGDLWKISSKVILDMRQDRSPFIETLQRYASVRLTQLMQSAVCSQFHTVNQRVCRWLSTMADRTGIENLAFTQELLAEMLGTRRPTIAVAMGQLQRQGLLSYNRGHIALLQRDAIRAKACECYSIVNKEIDNFVSGK